MAALVDVQGRAPIRRATAPMGAPPVVPKAAPKAAGRLPKGRIRRDLFQSVETLSSPSG